MLHKINGATAGALFGTALGISDLALASRHGSQVTGVGYVWPALLLSVWPAIGAVAGLVIERLPAAIVALVPATAAYWCGNLASVGNRAGDMPLAPYWGIIVAALAVLLAITAAKRWTRGRRVVIGCVGAWLVYAVAAFAQRGRYEDLRFAACCLAISVAAAATGSGAKRSGRVGIATAILFSLCGLAGLERVARDDALAIWAVEQGTAAAGPARLWRTWRAPGLDAATGETLSRSPFFGTEIDRRSSESLGEVDGVLLVTIDALRADLFDRDVGERRVTPNLDRMAADGSHFRRAYTAAARSQFSIFSMLSGLYPTHIMSRPGTFDDTPMIATRLRAHGVEARASYSDAIMTIADRDFRSGDMGFENPRRTKGLGDPSPEAVFDAVRPRNGGKWFAYVHLMRPHYPYDDAAVEFRTGTSEFAKYAAVCRHADRDLERLVQLFRDEGLLKRALVIVAADHGEEFMEHGGTHHGSQIWEEVVRVPLVVTGHGVVKRARDEVVSLCDVAATIDHVFRLPQDGRPTYAGRPLTPLLVDMPDPERPREVLVENLPFGPGLKEAKAALVGARWKLHLDERLEIRRLFDLEADPGETSDRQAETGDLAKRMTARLWGMRRWSETFDPRLFEGLSSREQLTLRGDFLDAASLYRHLHGKPDVPARVAARGIIRLALEREFLFLATLAEDYGSDEAPPIRQALAVARVASRASSFDAELGSLVAEPRRVASPSILVGIYHYATLRGQPLRDDLATANGWNDDIDVRMARANHAFELKRTRPSLELLREGLESTSPFTMAKACELVRKADVADLKETILARHARETESRFKADLLAALPRVTDPQMLEFLRKRAAEGAWPESAEALALLGFAKASFAGLHFHSLVDPNYRARCRGFEEPAPFKSRLSRSRVTMPLAVSPGGCRLALFLWYDPGALPPPVVELSAGAWKTVVRVAPSGGYRPLVYDIPRDVMARELVLAVIAGTPGQVSCSAVVLLKTP